MGTSISSLRENISRTEMKVERLELEQRLNVVERMVHGQLERKEATIIAVANNSRNLHPGAVVDKMKIVNITNRRDVNMSVTINMAITSFFEEIDLNLEDITLLLRQSSSCIVNKTSQGESEAYDMLVLESRKLALRYDVYYYRWNFILNNIRNIDGVVGVLLIKRLIDQNKSARRVIMQYRARNKRRIQQLKSRLRTKEDDERIIWRKKKKRYAGRQIRSKARKRRNRKGKK